MPTLHRPKVVAFDLIQTVFDLSVLKPRLEAVGLKGELLEVWFGRVLRDGMALDASGVFKPFPEVAASALEVLMDEKGVEPSSAKVQEVMKGFAELPAHPDARPAMVALKTAGLRVMLLSNGAQANTRVLMTKGNLDGVVERSVTIEEVKHWKPRPEVYLYAAREAGVQAGEMALVAAHAWDTHGAKRAGLISAWVPRTETRYASAMEEPDVKGDSLVDVAEKLLALSQA